MPTCVKHLVRDADTLKGLPRMGGLPEDRDRLTWALRVSDPDFGLHCTLHEYPDQEILKGLLNHAED